MAVVSILHKHITMARKAMRDDSRARIDGRSFYIKRYGKRYHIIMVHVTDNQRRARDMFADAQRLAKDDMQQWNRIRHWRRYARQHRILGPYRAAVSYYYKLLLQHGEQLRELHPQRPDQRLFYKEQTFYWINFDSVSDYRAELLSLCG